MIKVEITRTELLPPIVAEYEQVFIKVHDDFTLLQSPQEDLRVRTDSILTIRVIK